MPPTRQTLPFKIIEHTADIGLRIFGSSIKELFTNALTGLKTIMFDDSFEETSQYTISISAKDAESLLVMWLEELLYLFETKLFVAVSADLIKFDTCSLNAIIRGTNFDPIKHKAKLEIKAVTYHKLKIRKEGSTYSVDIIFDI